MSDSCKFCCLREQPMDAISYNSIVDVLLQVTDFIKLKANTGNEETKFS